MEEETQEFVNWASVPNNFTGKCKLKYDKSTHYLVNGEHHRLDGPANECSNGEKRWYKEGKLHRLNGPAFERDKDDNHWYKEGKLHRLDGPAREWFDGTKEWHVEGKRYTKEEFDKLPEVIMYKEGLGMFI
jgi:hypothetical protein